MQVTEGRIMTGYCNKCGWGGKGVVEAGGIPHPGCNYSATPFTSQAPAMQVTEEMVERAARAICRHRGIDPDAHTKFDWMSREVVNWLLYSGDARAALTAALTPDTEGGE